VKGKYSPFRNSIVKIGAEFFLAIKYIPQFQLQIVYYPVNSTDQIRRQET